MTAHEQELRRIAAELESLPYIGRTWNWGLTKKDGNAAGGDADIMAGCGGASVYHDVMSEGGHGTRSTVLEVANRVISGAVLRTKNQRETAEALRTVATLRLACSRLVSKPELPPDAGRWYRLASETSARLVAEVKANRLKWMRYRRLSLDGFTSAEVRDVVQADVNRLVERVRVSSLREGVCEW